MFYETLLSLSSPLALLTLNPHCYSMYVGQFKFVPKSKSYKLVERRVVVKTEQVGERPLVSDHFLVGGDDLTFAVT